MKQLTFFSTGEVDIYDFEDLIKAWVYSFGADSVVKRWQQKMLIISESEEFH